MISKKLKKLRENCGFTQQQIANALSIDRSTYAYYETGKTTPDPNTIVKLAKIFNVSLDNLLTEEVAPFTFRDEFDISKLYGNKNFSYVYELSNIEKQLIIYFRNLSNEEKQDILDDLRIRFGGKAPKESPSNNQE